MIAKMFHGVIDGIGGILNISPFELAQFKYNFFDKFKYLIYFLFVFIIIRIFIADYMKAETSSMNPTIVEGDLMIVNKLSYINSEPERGDIVMFKGVLRGEDSYIGKRIIGLPNDKIQLKNNVVYINGKKISVTKSNNELVSGKLLLNQLKYDGVLTFSSRQETLDNGVYYNTLSLELNHGVMDKLKSIGRDDIVKSLWKTIGERDSRRTTIEYKIPSDSYFAMGDNRDLSNDSRGSLGFIKKSDIVGEVNYIMFNRKNILSGDLRFMKKI